MRICSVEGCGKKHHSNDYCSKHYMQIYKYGEIQERTVFDRNEFIIDGDVCWILLYNRKCIEVARAKFDTKYYEYISDPRLKWCLNSSNYVITFWIDNDIQQAEYLHEAIIQLSGQIVQPGEEIDHKDRDKLNCLEENLRICSHSQNKQNVKKRKNNTSGQKGVYWYKQTRKWKAQIGNHGEIIPLGYFNTIEDTARAYNAAAIKLHGKFAVLNIIPGDDNV